MFIMFTGDDPFTLTTNLNDWLEANDVTVKLISQSQAPNGKILLTVFYE